MCENGPFIKLVGAHGDFFAGLNPRQDKARGYRCHDTKLPL